MRRDRFRNKVLSEGVEGTATVRRVAWYGEGPSTRDDFPELYWDLEVQVGTGTPYELDGGFKSPAWAAVVVRPGTQLPVRVHPSKPKRVAIDWDAWKASGGQAAAEEAARSAPPTGASVMSAGAAPAGAASGAKPAWKAQQRAMLEQAVRDGAMSQEEFDEAMREAD